MENLEIDETAELRAGDAGAEALMTEARAERFGRYELREYLGGGMADVYRAWDTLLCREVALKLLKPGTALCTDARLRFVREAQLACKCRHKNIVLVYDAGELGGRQFLTLEWLNGQTLRAFIDSGKCAGVSQSLNFAIQIAEALGYVHSLDIIHRDVKPANICIEPSGDVKLIDFGIARTHVSDYTVAVFAAGTPAYMAPEQLDFSSDRRITTAVDVYAFGNVLFEMLTGRRALRDTDSVELVERIRSNDLDLSPLDDARIRPELQDIVRRCLRTDPRDRWPDFRSLRMALERTSECSG
jgi:serine/threonine protein kinase